MRNINKNNKYIIDQISNEGVGFDCAFKIIVDTDVEKQNYPNDLKNLAIWCANNFTENYVIISEHSEIISGGCADNKLEPWRPNKDLIQLTYFLNCYNDDAILFKLKWM